MVGTFLVKNQGLLVMIQIKLVDEKNIFQNLEEASAKDGKNMAANVAVKSERASEKGTKIGSEVVSRNPKAPLFTIQNAKFSFHFGKRLYVGWKSTKN